MPLTLAVALAHLLGRRRQTAVSMLGVALGVGFFIAISGMMNGFHEFFRGELIESNPHIVVTDEFRLPAEQPLHAQHADAAVEIRRVLPRDPVRGINHAAEMLEGLAAIPGVAAAPTLRGQVLLRRAGRDWSVAVLGIDPDREVQVTSLASDMIAGTIDALKATPDGIILGKTLADRMGVEVGDAVNGVSRSAQVARLRVVGIFKTGLEALDSGQAFVGLRKQQSLQDRPRIVNEIRIRLDDVSRSIEMAALIESRWSYKAAPWEETNARVLAVFTLQNVIIYSTVGAILIVAGFGIFNVISTVVLEKARDIAIMKSIGFSGASIARIFVIEGLIVGVLGSLVGFCVGFGIAEALRAVPAPGATDPNQTLLVSLPAWRYALAGGLATLSAVVAGWLPARRAARTNPLEIIRGAA
ncbi:MAG: ABC transporter permease [Alphaproteobacteria bacterium]|nr:ABC transporter permease [Alphaproteobacteria bacterium]